MNVVHQISLSSIGLAFATLVAFGDMQERPAPNGTSPDGRYEVLEVGSADDEGYAVEIRETDNKNTVLGKCYCGYGSLKVTDDYTNVLWKPDSKFVAIKVRGTKRTFDTTLFYLNGHQAKEVKPDLDYFQNICGRMGTLGNDFRNTNIGPTAWNGDDLTLKVEVPSLSEDVEVAFDVTLSCRLPFSSYNSTDPEPHAAVVKITGPTQVAP